MAERVFRILTNLYKNLTDCVDKTLVGTVCEKNSSGLAHSFMPDVPLVSSRIEKKQKFERSGNAC